MFWNKKKVVGSITTPELSVAIKIQTIPDIFYGGNDPEIYHSKPISGVGLSAGSSRYKTISKSRPKNKFSLKLIIISSSGVFVLAVAGISWYYLRNFESLPAANNVASVTPIISVDNQTVTTPELSVVQTVVPTTTLSVETPVSTALQELPLEFPASITIDTPDLDQDSLTDIEEELFDTDSGAWDTDTDGYYDGQEVYNLYNPKGFAPVKIIDSGLALEYVSPNFDYRLYYPSAWQLGVVNTDGKQVLFSALSGEYVEVRVMDRDLTEDFVAWFGRTALGQRITDIQQISNRFQIEVWRRKDGLVAYVVNGRQIYVLTYHSPETGPVAFRQVMDMMVQSFRPGKTFFDIPEQSVLPGIITTTITNEVETVAITSE